jgi:hypothetical protein
MFDNSITRQEVAFWRTFPLGNNRDYTKQGWTKLLLSQPHLCFSEIKDLTISLSLVD